MWRLILVTLAVSCLGWAAEVDRSAIIFDGDNLPAGWPEDNPFNILASMNSWTKPVLDHAGKPHAHGHVVQLIVDGGNGLQDAPRPDGSPGGDDSLAYGNFNMVRVEGVTGDSTKDGHSGMFYSQKYFIPLVPERSYYMRLWEGNDSKMAPFYQDTIEYSTADDKGGAMVHLKPGLPIDIDWTFGRSQPRPVSAAPKKTDNK
jgi:hypothetical protein